MPRRDSPNYRMLEAAARYLGPIVSDVVFVGGQVTELLITDPAAARIRPTDDVDVIVAVGLPAPQYSHAAAGLR